MEVFMVFSKFTEIINEAVENYNFNEGRSFLLSVLKLGDYLNINTEFYQAAVIKATSGKPSGLTLN